jgi:hypothetical protein
MIVMNIDEEIIRMKKMKKTGDSLHKTTDNDLEKIVDRLDRISGGWSALIKELRDQSVKLSTMNEMKAELKNINTTIKDMRSDITNMAKLENESLTYWEASKRLKPGMRVKILKSYPSYENGWENCWTTDMDELIGEIHTIKEITVTGVTLEGVNLKSLKRLVHWPAQVLEPVKEEETYCIGDQFTDGKEDYLLACVVGKVCLINIDTGNYYYCTSERVSDVRHIKASEVVVLGSTFKLKKRGRLV